MLHPTPPNAPAFGKPITLPPPANLRAAELFRRLKALLARIEACAVELDAIVCEFPELIPLLGASAETSHLRAVLLRADAKRLQFQKDQARCGASSVKLIQQDDNHALVEIDERPGVLLPPFVAALLAVLIADRGTKADQFVGWKSLDTIRLELKESTGSTPSNAAIKELILRLRNLLEAHGENRFLVQSKRNFGYRFALRRTQGGMTTNDHR